MSGQLGELVVSISADLARFQADMGKSVKTTETTMKQIQASVDSGVTGLKASFDKISKGLAAVTAIAAGGALFKDMIDSTKAWNGEVMALSRTMGMNLTEASAYRTALRIAGVDQDTATTATAKLTKTLATNEQAFKNHGISVRDSNGKLLSMQQIITNTFEALGKLETGTSRNSAAMELFGRNWVQLQGMAKITNPLLAESRQLTEDLGLTLDGKTSDAVKKYGQEMNKLKLVHEAFKVNVGEAVLPTLTQIEKGFNNVAIAAARMKSKNGMGETFTLDLASLVLMEKRLNSSEFLLHPIDTIRQLTTDLGKMKKVADSMGVTGPGGKPAGEEYDAAKAAAAAAEADKKRLAAATAAAAALQRENEYIKVYNQLQTERTRLGIQESTELTATQKKIEERRLQYADWIRQYPEYRAELERNFELDKQNITNLAAKSDALKIQNAELKKSIQLYEELNKDMEGFGKYTSRGALELPKIGGSFGKNGAFTGGPKFSLTGTAETPGFGGNPTNPAITQAKKEAEERLAIEKQFNYQMSAMKLDAADQALAIARSAAGDNKAVQLAILVAETGIAIKRIMMAEGVALMNAKASTSILGPAGDALYAAQAAEISTMAGISIGLAVAGGAMQAIQLAGQRANGGPVEAGKTYLVGERGPELMTMGGSGYVTPNDRIGGGVTIHMTNQIDARGADQGVELRIQTAMKQAKDQAKAEILNDMNRGGRFAVASGRR